MSGTGWNPAAYCESPAQSLLGGRFRADGLGRPPDAFPETMWGIGADEAYSLASLAVDFAVTQVVDQRLGVPAAIAKFLFSMEDGS